MTNDLQATLEAMANQLLGEHGMDQAALSETAVRLGGLIKRVRELDERAFAEIPPGFSFAPGHSAYRQPPAVSEAAAMSATGQVGYSGVPAAGADAAADTTAQPPSPAIADDEIAGWSLVRQAEAVRNREISAVELVGRALEQAQTLGAELNVFVSLTAEQALAAAEAADRRLAAGEAVGPLHGVPIAHKDLLYAKGAPTTAGSAIFADFVPERDATAVRRLADAGAISIGKTNTHQFAFGATTDSSHVGATLNPHDPRRSPGGSSGGSGAAVAARIVACATGTDTGGSIRIPAAACGVFGIKPTYGRVSKAGAFPLSWSLDHIGPLTTNAADAALVLMSMAGADPEDPTAADREVDDYLAAVRQGQRDGVGGLKIGILDSWVDDRVEPEIQQAVADAAKALAEAGAVVDGCEYVPAGVPTLVNRLIALAEAGSYHAPLLAKHREKYAPDVRARMDLGQFVLARDYILGQRMRLDLTRRLNDLLAKFDIILAPTLPIGAPLHGSTVVAWPEGPEAVPDALIRFTAPFNVTGHPVASVPFGKTSYGMPAAIQLLGRPFEERTVFRAAAALEQAAWASGGN